MLDDSSIQRIARLTPLPDVLAVIDSGVGSVMPRESLLATAVGCILAEDVTTPVQPPHQIALRDGYAVEAAGISDAGPYAPVPLPSQPARVDVGQRLPDGTDAVAPFDAITDHGNGASAIASVAPGEGVLLAGGDATPQKPLRRAGEVLRTIDCAVLAACGISLVTIRMPRVRLVRGSAASAPVIDAALDILTRAISDAGAAVLDARDDAKTFEEALSDGEADAVIAVGGTGSGSKDDAVKTLRRCGRVEAHGIAVATGETAAFGFVGTRPVLVVPGRIDAALALSLLVGGSLIAKLADGGGIDAPVALLPLKRKTSSALGLAELIPVRCADGMAEPLASGYLSFEALARSNGWIIIPANSEGFAAGTPVAIRPWP